MKVLNRATNKYIDRDKAFPHKIKNGQLKESKYLCGYFANFSEYREWDFKKNTRAYFNALCSEVCGEFASTFPKFLSPLADKYGYEMMYQCLYDNKDSVSASMDRKDFKNVFNKTKYFVAIMQNLLATYKPVKKQITIIDIDYEPIEMKYKAKKKRKSISEIESDFDLEGE